MNAMEKMVANMLGMTPEAMHDTLAGLQNLAGDLKAKLDAILENQGQLAKSQAESVTSSELENLTAEMRERFRDLENGMATHASNIAEGFRDLKGAMNDGGRNGSGGGRRAGSRERGGATGGDGIGTRGSVNGHDAAHE